MPGPFTARRVDSAADFLEQTLPLRAADPVMTNLVGSIAATVVNGRTYDAEYWWVVRDEAGAVVGCALRTHPYRLVVAPMPIAAATTLGRAVAATDRLLPGVNGPADVVAAFYTGLASPRPHRQTMHDLVYVLGTYKRAIPAAGRARKATAADAELAAEWNRQFHVDAGLPLVEDPARSVQTWLGGDRLWLWEDDGRPVAMAAHAEPVVTPAGVVARIGPVFTPEGLRRNGYGASVTCSVVDSLLPTTTVVMLFADVANPASNSIYRRLGFEVVGELVETELSQPST